MQDVGLAGFVGLPPRSAAGRSGRGGRQGSHLGVPGCSQVDDTGRRVRFRPRRRGAAPPLAAARARRPRRRIAAFRREPDMPPAPWDEVNDDAPPAPAQQLRERGVARDSGNATDRPSRARRHHRPDARRRSTAALTLFRWPSDEGGRQRRVHHRGTLGRTPREAAEHKSQGVQYDQMTA